MSDAVLKSLTRIVGAVRVWSVLWKSEKKEVKTMNDLAESIRKTWPGMTVFVDVDGTYARWQTMHSFFEAMVAYGAFPEVTRAMLEKNLSGWKNRELPFREFIDCMVRVFRTWLPGIRTDVAEFVATSMLKREGRRVNVFVRELLSAAREVGLTNAFISGSPEVVVRALAKAVGVEIFLGTEYPHEDGVYVPGEPRQWVLDKGEAVRHLAHMYRLKLEDSVAIGDSEGDIPMFESVRWPICFNPNDVLFRAARERSWPVVIERKNVILCFKPDISGRLQETALAAILPQWLAGTLQDRLRPWSCL